MSKATPINSTMGRTDWLLLVALSGLWGGSFFFAEVALVELRPFTVVWLRVGLAAVALLLVCRLCGVALPRERRAWGAFFVMGGLNNLIPFSLIVWGQIEIASSLAAILNAMTPVFTVLLAHLLTRDEKLTPGRLVGVLVGLVGVTVMVGPHALAGLGVAVVAQLAVLAAALSYAFAGIYGRRFRGQNPLITATGQLVATTVVMTPIALAVDQPWNIASLEITTYGAIVGLALVSTAPAYWIYFRILASAGATNLLLVTLLMPGIAILLGVVFLRETIAVAEIAGVALIAVGLAAIDGRLLSAVRSYHPRRPKQHVSAARRP